MHNPTKLGIMLFLGILAIFLGAVFDAIGLRERSESMLLALKIIATILTLFLCGALLYLWRGFGKWLYHDIMEWHMPTDSQGFDGCSFTSTCKYCGKEIMQDSQGNWF